MQSKWLFIILLVLSMTLNILQFNTSNNQLVTEEELERTYEQLLGNVAFFDLRRYD